MALTHGGKQTKPRTPCFCSSISSHCTRKSPTRRGDTISNYRVCNDDERSGMLEEVFLSFKQADRVRALASMLEELDSSQGEARGELLERALEGDREIEQLLQSLATELDSSGLSLLLRTIMGVVDSDEEKAELLFRKQTICCKGNAVLLNDIIQDSMSAETRQALIVKLISSLGALDRENVLKELVLAGESGHERSHLIRQAMLALPKPEQAAAAKSMSAGLQHVEHAKKEHVHHWTLRTMTHLMVMLMEKD